MSAKALTPFNANKHKAIFISDVHLGSKGSHADKLLDFLQNNECEHLYMVGDIVDGWRLKQKLFWPDEHMILMKYVLHNANKRMKVTYITGNHDEFLRRYSGVDMGCIELVDECIYSDDRGGNFLVIHGDQFDVVTTYARWVSVIGDIGYNFLLRLNRYLNKFRTLVGLPYWSLSRWAKDRVKRAVNFVGDFESNVAKECRARDIDGVICGHTHKAAIKEIEGFKYLNSGDWVESCTAILHRQDGSFELYNYFDEQNSVEKVVELSLEKAA